MQGLPSEGGKGGLRLGPQLVRLGLEMGAIDGVSQQGMTDMGQVHADLVGASGLKLAGEQACDRFAVAPGKALLDFPMGHGFPAALPDSHFLPCMGVTVDRRIDRAALPVRYPPDKGKIAAPHWPRAAVIGELRRERLMGEVVLGDDHQSGGIFVQPVHDAGAPDAADAGQARAAMGDQRIDQRAGLVPGRGVHHQSPGLVDDNDVVVLVDDIERDILALGLRGGGLGYVDCDRIARSDVISGVADRGGPMLEADRSRQDQGLQP